MRKGTFTSRNFQKKLLKKKIKKEVSKMEITIEVYKALERLYVNQIVSNKFTLLNTW